MCENNFITQAAHQKKSLQFMGPPGKEPACDFVTWIWHALSNAEVAPRGDVSTLQARGPCREEVSMGSDSTTHFSFRYDCSIMLMNVYSLAVAVVHARGT